MHNRTKLYENIILVFLVFFLPFLFFVPGVISISIHQHHLQYLNVQLIEIRKQSGYASLIEIGKPSASHPNLVKSGNNNQTVGVDLHIFATKIAFLACIWKTNWHGGRRKWLGPCLFWVTLLWNILYHIKLMVRHLQP